ncbi:MAG: helicase associated domain-containing protein [Microbacteriaceae bacterium]|nr:helicase associated domain-containing protein [Microbacteriaceae bacterium]
MHPNGDAFNQFHRRWAAEARMRRFAMTTSAEHYLAELGADSGSARTGKWLVRCRELEAHVSRTGTFPTVGKGADPGVRRIAEWVRYQRRAKDSLSDYQRERLELIPGWVWRPQEQRWHDHLHDYENFTRAHGRRPRRRSSDKAETRLAIWHRNQRRLANSACLASDRDQVLSQLDVRIKALLRPAD